MSQKFPSPPTGYQTLQSSQAAQSSILSQAQALSKSVSQAQSLPQPPPSYQSQPVSAAPTQIQSQATSKVLTRDISQAPSTLPLSAYEALPQAQNKLSSASQAISKAPTNLSSASQVISKAPTNLSSASQATSIASTNVSSASQVISQVSSNASLKSQKSNVSSQPASTTKQGFALTGLEVSNFNSLKQNYHKKGLRQVYPMNISKLNDEMKEVLQKYLDKEDDSEWRVDYTYASKLYSIIRGLVQFDLADVYYRGLNLSQKEFNSIAGNVNSVIYSNSFWSFSKSKPTNGNAIFYLLTQKGKRINIANLAKWSDNSDDAVLAISSPLKVVNVYIDNGKLSVIFMLLE